LKHLNFFRKLAEIFASQGAPSVSTTPAANFATSFACIVDTGAKFAAGVNDTGGKIAAGVNDTGGNLPPVSQRIFEKIPNRPTGILRGSGETDS
jgi:hypothetical protein